MKASGGFVCDVVAYGATSALGDGMAALGIGAPGDAAPNGVQRDATLAAAALDRPFCARASGGAAGDAAHHERDPATVLLELALDACAAELDVVLPAWRTKRVGLAIGTSSGGMCTFERLFARDPSRADDGEQLDADPARGATNATYLGPVLAATRPCDVAPMAFVLGACASGTLAIGLAREWLRTGQCDIALAGGFDAVSVFVASGFEVLRATCSERGPRPFRVGRDGLALGEGAAVVALVPATARRELGLASIGSIAGFGATCDAVHLTAPDREGRGLARAASHAMEEAGAPGIGLVSAHGTATAFNDGSEAAALTTLFGDARAAIPLHALKGGIGHTLGAAGALETLAALEALRRDVAPASVGDGPIEGGVKILDHVEASRARFALKTSAAFGGANAALVLAKATDDGAASDPPAPPASPVYLSRAVALTFAAGESFEDATRAARLAALTGYAEDRIARADPLVRLTMAAVAELRDALGGASAFEGAGILVGHGLATIDTNALYLARIRAAGANRGEPRRFPYTTPNAPAGECAVAFGLRGPSFAVGGGPHGGIEAIAVAADLVRGGHAPAMVVVAVDEAGAGSRRLAPETKPGAVAVLVASAKTSIAIAGVESVETSLRRGDSSTRTAMSPPAVEAHRALVPLVRERPASLEVETASGGFAKVRLFWL